MKKLIIVLFISLMLLSIPCATAGDPDDSDIDISVPVYQIDIMNRIVKDIDVIAKDLTADDKKYIINIMKPSTPGDIFSKLNRMASENNKAYGVIGRFVGTVMKNT